MVQDRIPFWTFCRHRHLWYYAWFSLMYYMWVFFLFSFLTKIQYTFSVLTSVSYSLERMMYNSVAECLPSIHRGLGLIPNTTRMKSKTIEFFGIFQLTNSVTLNTQSLPMLLEPHWWRSHGPWPQRNLSLECPCWFFSLWCACLRS